MQILRPAPQGLADRLRGKQKKIWADHDCARLQDLLWMTKSAGFCIQTGQEPFFSFCKSKILSVPFSQQVLFPLLSLAVGSLLSEERPIEGKGGFTSQYGKLSFCFYSLWNIFSLSWNLPNQLQLKLFLRKTSGFGKLDFNIKERLQQNYSDLF